jgi:hypothetical protein
MYDSPEYYLVPNPLDRYSVGSRSEHLRYDDDGSLTILLQNEPPDSPRDAGNWLPTPAGDFRPMMRMFQPGREIVDGSYVLPPIERIE